MRELRFQEAATAARGRGSAAWAETAANISDRVLVALNRVSAGSQRAAQAVSVFLTPLAMLALALGLWGLVADLGWAGDFAITNGIFSHWQVWIALAIGIRMTGGLLDRPARTAVPENSIQPRK